MLTNYIAPIFSRDEEDIKENFNDLIGNVRHPNVVAYLDFLLHEERKQLGIKMEYVCNGSLYNLMVCKQGSLLTKSLFSFVVVSWGFRFKIRLSLFIYSFAQFLSHL
jgi:hypothetical protein